MLARILKSFPHSPDGVQIEHLPAGELCEVRADLFEGLKAAGYVQAGEQGLIEPPVAGRRARKRAGSAESSE